MIRSRTVRPLIQRFAAERTPSPASLSTPCNQPSEYVPGAAASATVIIMPRRQPRRRIASLAGAPRSFPCAGKLAAAAASWSAILVCLLLPNTHALSQAPAANQQQPAEAMVQLNLQGEVRLQALIDYVSQRLKIKFMYGPDVANRRVTVRTPSEIPVSSLLPLLGSVLRMEGLALVDADVPGWKRIVDAAKIPNFARPKDPRQAVTDSGGATPVTQAFVLQHINAQQLTQVLRPFLSQPGSNVLALQDTNVVVVTDFASTVLTVEKLIELVDRPRGDVVFEFYEVKNLQSATLAEQVKSMLMARMGVPAGTEKFVGVELLDEPRTNQIAVVGSQELVDAAMDLLKRLDVSLMLTTKVYRIQHVQAERIDRIVKGFVPAKDVERIYQSSTEKDGNLLIARTTQEIHERIAELQQQIDVPIPTSQSPIRFYRLKNANALDVLYTLMALQEAAGTSVLTGEGLTGTSQLLNGEYGMPGRYTPFGGGNQFPLPLNVNPLRRNLNQPQLNPDRPLQLPLQPTEEPGPYETLRETRSEAYSGILGAQLAQGGTAVLPGGARVSADVTTNSLVVVAPPDAHEMYRNLIESLDRRRPQVMIEAKIVAVDTSDNFTLGVEVSGGDRTGSRRLFQFTSFGLSEVNPETGALLEIPMLGFNGTLVDPNVADVVVKALAAHSRARVLAAPRILVNDNSTGQLESVMSVPFESVNASQTVSTTSLGGNQQAGTIITVTPHINEDRHLRLEFSVEFSTFGEASPTSTLPPPRQIERVESSVTIPDGQTVVVGGLKRTGRSDTTTGVPFIESIPLLSMIASLNTEDVQTTSFFLFIRPLVLRDDKFADLKFVSEKSARSAEIAGEHPVSRPILIP